MALTPEYKRFIEEYPEIPQEERARAFLRTPEGREVHSIATKASQAKMSPEEGLVAAVYRGRLGGLAGRGKRCPNRAAGGRLGGRNQSREDKARGGLAGRGKRCPNRSIGGKRCVELHGPYCPAKGTNEKIFEGLLDQKLTSLGLELLTRGCKLKKPSGAFYPYEYDCGWRAILIEYDEPNGHKTRTGELNENDQKKTRLAQEQGFLLLRIREWEIPTEERVQVALEFLLENSDYHRESA